MNGVDELTSHDVEEARSTEAAEAFLEAAERWLREHGPDSAARFIGQLSLRGATTPDDLMQDALVSLYATVQRHGAPRDPSDGDAVAAYVYKTLRHRAFDHLRVTRRRRVESPWPDDEVVISTDEDEEVVAPVLTQLLFDCVHRVLSQRLLTLRDATVVPVALAAVASLQVGPPADSPAPQTTGNMWTRAGWAALHAVDRAYFFPDEEAVQPNTATQRRRAALANARALISTAAAECGAQG